MNPTMPSSFSASYASVSLWPTAVARQTQTNVQSNAHPTSGEKGEKIARLLQTALVLFVLLCFGMLFSLFAPFFPSEAAKKGMSPTVVGLLFGCYELIVFLLSPVWGILASQIGFRFMTASGMLLSGGATVLFGFLDQCPEGAVYIICCFCCRIVEAIGVSMYITAAFAYGSSLYPNDVAFIYGLLETFNGAGFMLGPPLGGILYKAGGFFLPFLSIGSLILVLGSISAVTLKSAEEKIATNSLSPLLLLQMPIIIILGFSEAVCALIFAFLDPTLSIFLIGLGIDDPIVIGAMFMVCSVAYTVACLFTGKAVEWWDAPYTFMVLGAALTCIGYLLIGPSPLIPFFQPNEASIIVACFTGFAGLGFIMIPFPKLLTEHLLERGFPSDMETNALISGVYNCVWYFGSFIGPSIAGAMVDGIGFLWSTTVMAMLAALICIILVITATVVKSERSKICDQYRYTVFVTDESVTTTSCESRSGGQEDEEERSGSSAGSGAILEKVDEKSKDENNKLVNDSDDELSVQRVRLWHSVGHYGATHWTSNKNVLVNQST